MIQQICHDAKALSGDQGHEFNVSIGDRHLLRGDESQLRSAFSNLIFNAVKYTPAGGLITIIWKTDRDGDNNVIIVPGFSEEGMVSGILHGCG